MALVKQILNEATNKSNENPMSNKTSTKNFSLVDLPESSRIKQKVIDEYFDKNFDEEVTLSRQNTIDANLYPSPTRTASISSEKPEPQHLVYENTLPKDLTDDTLSNAGEPASPANIKNIEPELVEQKNRGDYSKGLKATAEIKGEILETYL